MSSKGQRISRSEALQIARDTINQAERERAQQDVAEFKSAHKWFASAAVMPGRVTVFGLDGDEVCSVRGNLAEEETAEERAQLIATAPKLLAEIENTLNLFREAPLWTRNRMLREVLCLIARLEMLVDEAKEGES